MISLYTSAVLTTVVVAGLAAYAVETSSTKTVAVMDSGLMRETHYFGLARGKYANLTQPPVDQVVDLPTGPFYEGGRAHNILVVDAETVNGTPEVNRYMVTTLTPSGHENAATAQRIASAFSPPEGTHVGVVGDDGSISGGVVLPPVGISISAGDVVAVTRIGT